MAILCVLRVQSLQHGLRFKLSGLHIKFKIQVQHDTGQDGCKGSADIPSKLPVSKKAHGLLVQMGPL